MLILTREDRCDGCGAAAKHRADLLNGGVLLFCDHHMSQHRDQLLDEGATVTSQTVVAL